MLKSDPQYAIIYCRVSTTKQVKKGDGLGSQETRCRQYAQSMGYTVEAVFPDDVTGKGDYMKRPGMVALLSYLDAQPNKSYIVIFDDLKRFARDTEFHIKLRRAFKVRGARIECLNFKFEDTPEGKFIETILAAQGELEREQNGRQVLQKMQARVANGYWCFNPSVGYKYRKVSGHGKLLVRDEPLASIVAEAFKGYASRRFESVTEVKRFLESQPSYPHDRNGEVHLQRVHDVLSRSLYAGYIDVPKWGISMQAGKHEPLIDLATWKVVQDRLNEISRAPVRKDINEDFPLRGFVTCGCCGRPMTAAWSVGRSAKYAYYSCQTKSCGQSRKSIRREQVEGDFAALLQGLVPSRELFLMIYDMLSDLWESRMKLSDEVATQGKEQIRLIERKTDQLMDRIVTADSDTLIAAYENQIKKLEKEKLYLAEKMANCGRPVAGFKETYRTAMEFLANPYKLWASERLEDKRLVLRLAFADRLPYVKNQGYRTAETTLPFKALMALSPGRKEMVVYRKASFQLIKHPSRYCNKMIKSTHQTF